MATTNITNFTLSRTTGDIKTFNASLILNTNGTFNFSLDTTDLKSGALGWTEDNSKRYFQLVQGSNTVKIDGKTGAWWRTHTVSNASLGNISLTSSTNIYFKVVNSDNLGYFITATSGNGTLMLSNPAGTISGGNGSQSSGTSNQNGVASVWYNH